LNKSRLRRGETGKKARAEGKKRLRREKEAEKGN
jgi:hypothetical protein